MAFGFNKPKKTAENLTQNELPLNNVEVNKLSDEQQALQTKNEFFEEKADKFSIISGKVGRYLFKNEENGFVVVSINLNNPIDVKLNEKLTRDLTEIVIVGSSLEMIKNINVGQEVKAWGHFALAKKTNNLQFEFSSVQEPMPTSEETIRIFLGSGKVKGLGPVTARRIVEKFGLKSLDILSSNPEALLIIPGITEKKLDPIKKSWEEIKQFYDVSSFLMVYGIGDLIATKIVSAYKEKSLNIIKTDPYKLMEIDGVGFKNADKIAISSGTSMLDAKRIQKGIYYALEDIANKEGSTVCPIDKLELKTKELLGISSLLIKPQIQALIDSKDLEEKEIIVKGRKRTCVGLAKYIAFEQKIAENFHRIQSFDNIPYDKKMALSNAADEFLLENPNKLDDSQLEAAKKVLVNKVSILTGGPGTGKTHTIKSLLDFYERQGYKIKLLAPTGKAAKKIEESTGRRAETIHRALKYNPSSQSFIYNKENRFTEDVYVCDESSMVGIFIAKNLLEALPDHARIIVVGDKDQLASVEAGNVFADLIASKAIPVGILKIIHRQSEKSNIVTVAASVIHNKTPEMPDLASGYDCTFDHILGNERIEQRIVNIVKALMSKLNVHPNDIQILSPTKQEGKEDNNLSTVELNLSLRKILNPSYASQQDLLEDAKIKFLSGERVMQLKNNYDLDIFNGDVGYIQIADFEENALTVDFGKEDFIELLGKNTSEVEMNYASTIHKAQGSDYPYVIIPITRSHLYQWDANLLYTAITRGRKKVIIVGDKNLISHIVKKNRNMERLTTLCDAVKILFNQKDIVPFEDSVSTVERFSI